MRVWAMALQILFAAICSPASAHTGTESYLVLEESAAHLTGQWDIALQDIEREWQADSVPRTTEDATDRLAANPRLTEIELSRLRLSTDNINCRLDEIQHAVIQRTSGLYLALRFKAHCADNPHKLTVDYGSMFQFDPSHLGLFKLESGGSVRSAVFTAESSSQTFTLRAPGLWERAASDILSGLWHIWTGLDHLLFLLCLLLPSVQSRYETAKGIRLAPKTVLVEVLKVVTAFTLAHSITLSLAAMQVLTLPSRLTESIIALSVLIAAFFNIYPSASFQPWQAAFGFGLIHGFGFASALTELRASGFSLATTLVSFNLGVEIGQLAVVCLVLPLAYLFGGRQWYQPVVLRGASMVIGLLALMWFIERAFDWHILQI